MHFGGVRWGLSRAREGSTVTLVPQAMMGETLVGKVVLPILLLRYGTEGWPALIPARPSRASGVRPGRASPSRSAHSSTESRLSVQGRELEW